MSTTPLSTPTNYNQSTVWVIPQNIEDALTAINTAITTISDSLNNIFTELNGLRLSWGGPSATAAQDLNEAWQAIILVLFGFSFPAAEVALVPSLAQFEISGALQTLENGIDQAAQSYAATEQAVHDMFNNMYNNLTSTSTAANPAVTMVGDMTGIGIYMPYSDNGTDAPYYTTAVDET